MSYSISYRREVRWIPCPETHINHCIDPRLFFVFEEIGDNNVTECTGRHPALERRARHWTCVIASTEHACFSELARRSSSCPIGDLKFAGSSRYATPEGYLKSWRIAFKNALPLLPTQPEWPALEEGRPYRFDNPADKKAWSDAGRANRMRFHVILFAHTPLETEDPGDRYRSELLMNQHEVVPLLDTHSDPAHHRRRWVFDINKPDQVALWLDARGGRTGWQSCEVRGPR